MRHRCFLPTTDRGLLAWSANAAVRVAAEPGVYNVTPEWAAEYVATQAAYAAALKRATEPGTRGPVSVEKKNAAKKALDRASRELARWIRAQPGVTQAQWVDLGLLVRRKGSRAVVPATRPVVFAKAAAGGRLEVRLSDSVLPARRGRPRGVRGARVYVHVGAAAPEKLDDWTQVVMTQERRRLIDVRWPAADRGSLGVWVWVTARWVNNLEEVGPLATPVRLVMQPVLTTGASRLAA